MQGQIRENEDQEGLFNNGTVIVRSIQEFLARHAAPSALQIYEEVMQQADDGDGDAPFDLLRD